MTVSRENYEVIAYKEFVKEFGNETDRAAVILGVAKLDALLYQLLSKFLVSCPTSQDDLFDIEKPLSTFSAKINIAYRLGLINADFSRSLHLIRRIRNDFAHEISGCSLDQCPHRDRVDNLVGTFLCDEFYSFRKIFFKDEHSAGVNFRTVLGVIVVRILSAIEDTVSLNNGKAYGAFPPKWKIKQSLPNIENSK